MRDKGGMRKRTYSRFMCGGTASAARAALSSAGVSSTERSHLATYLQ